MAATAHLTLEEIRKGLSWRKQLDKVFIVIGMALLFGCLAILAILSTAWATRTFASYQRSI